MNNAGVTSITAGVIEDGDISGTAAIDATKLADGSVNNTEFQYINSLTSNAQSQIDNLSSEIGDVNTLADGNIYLGDGTNTAQEVTLSGDVTMNNAGVTSITTGAVGSTELGHDAVTNVQLADNAVQTENILDGEITTLDIADNSVTLDKIQDGFADQVLTTDGTGNPQYEDRSNFFVGANAYTADAASYAEGSVYTLFDLDFEVGANEVWTFEYHLQVRCNGNAGTTWQFNIPTEAAIRATIKGVDNNNIKHDVIIESETMTGPFNTQNIGDIVWIEISGAIETGPNSGPIQLQLASVGSGQSTVVEKYSYVTARRIN